MTEPVPVTEPFPAAEVVQPLPRARSYVWRLLALIPAAVMLAIGGWAYTHPPAGGQVQSIRLATKSSLSGQARDAYDSVDPRTPDLYLKVSRTNSEAEIQLPPFNDTPVGNGLTFTLSRPTDLLSIGQISVWDENVLSDKQLDRIELSSGAWFGEGQTFRVDLYGIHPTPPDWALPLAAVGGTLALVVLLRFVWDQAL